MRLVSAAALLPVVLVVGTFAGCGAEEPDATATSRAAPPDLAEIVCDGATATVLTPRVRPRRDGIHFSFSNDAGKPLSYSIESKRAGGVGADLPAAGADVVVSLPPGRLGIACSDPRSDDDPSEQERVELTVVDPMGIWTPSVLSSTCSSAVSTIVDYAAGAKGDTRSPIQAATRFLRERGVLEAGDLIETAGYPEQEPTVVRLEREGETMVVIDFVSDGGGGWLLSTINACEGMGLR